MTRNRNDTLTNDTINTLLKNGILEGILLIAEMYLQGVSTRRVTTVMEKPAAWR